MKLSSILSILSVLVLVALFAGCASVDQDVAASPKEYWQPVEHSQPAQPLALTESPATVSGTDLTLPALIDLALDNNPNTRSAWYNAKSAAARLGETNSQYYPQITGNFDLDRNKVRTVGLNGSSFGAQTTYSTFIGPSIEINYVLWNFGKNYAQTESDRQALYAANYQYNQQIQDVILATELGYFNYDAALGFVDAAQATLNDANTAYKAASQRLSAGLGTKQEERQAFAQVKNAEFQLEQSQAQVETTRAQLAQSLGIGVNGNLKIVRSQKPADSVKLDSDISNLMALAMRQRPDLMAAYAEVLSTEHSLDAAKDDRWPTLSAVSRLTYGYEYGGVTYGNPSNNYMVGLDLSWKIFTGFEQTYAILDAQAKADAAKAALHAQELQVVTDVWNFYYSYKSALQQVDSANAQVDAQQEAYNAIQTGYNAGLNSYVDLLTSQKDLATARQQKVQAEATLGAALSNLAHATGGITVGGSSSGSSSSQ
ncbi:MAG TPA: TolC family protein [Opitutales bacterium]|nr:TolC family protein [Opitutales bacterium]